MERTKTLETSLVLTTAFLVVYMITGKNLYLYIAFGLGITGIFIKPLAKIIAVGWFKLAEILNYLMSKIILGVLFFVVLFPVSILYKMSNKDKLRLKKAGNTTWNERNHKYSATDLDNIW